MKKYILASTVPSIITYAIVAFVTWKSNPIKWEEGGKVMAVLMATILTIVSVEAVHENKK